MKAPSGTEYRMTGGRLFACTPHQITFRLCGSVVLADVHFVAALLSGEREPAKLTIEEKQLVSDLYWSWARGVEGDPEAIEDDDMSIVSMVRGLIRMVPKLALSGEPEAKGAATEAELEAYRDRLREKVGPEEFDRLAALGSALMQPRAPLPRTEGSERTTEAEIAAALASGELTPAEILRSWTEANRREEVEREGRVAAQEALSAQRAAREEAERAHRSSEAERYSLHRELATARDSIPPIRAKWIAEMERAERVESEVATLTAKLEESGHEITGLSTALGIEQEDRARLTRRLQDAVGIASEVIGTHAAAMPSGDEDSEVVDFRSRLAAALSPTREAQP